MGQCFAADAGRRASRSAVADPDQQDTSPLLAKTLFERPKGQERTSTSACSSRSRAKQVRFTNVEQEWPIGEFARVLRSSGRGAGVASPS